MHFCSTSTCMSVADCGQPPDVANSENNSEGDYFEEGTVVTYTCNTAFKMESPHSGSVTCLYNEITNSGSWTSGPYCIPGTMYTCIIHTPFISQF